MTNEFIVWVYMLACIFVIVSCLILLGLISDVYNKKTAVIWAENNVLWAHINLLISDKLILHLQLDRVYAMHYERPHNMLEDFMHFGQTEFPNLCNHCKSHYPCATIKAIEPMEGD